MPHPGSQKVVKAEAVLDEAAQALIARAWRVANDETIPDLDALGHPIAKYIVDQALAPANIHHGAQLGVDAGSGQAPVILNVHANLGPKPDTGPEAATALEGTAVRVLDGG
jgi:hypothetical protein